MVTAIALDTQPQPPPLRMDAARFALVQSIRLWKIEVRLAAEKLLSLGQAYEVQYTFPRVRMPGATHGERELRDFGFDVMPVAGSHLFQVNEVRTVRFSQRFVETGWNGTERSSAISSIGLNDYLVGIGADNLLLSSMKLPRLRRRVSDVLACAEREQAAGRASTVRLKFVRYDNQARVDPLQNRGHGQILQILDELDTHQARLAKQYEALVTRHRDAKKQLQVEKKVLMFVRIILHETRSSVMKVHEFKFMAGFRSWYKTLNEPVSEDDFNEDFEAEDNNFEFGDGATSNDQMTDVDNAAGPEVVSIESPDEEDEHEMSDLTHPDTIDDDSDDEGVVQLLDLAPTAPAWKAPTRTGRLERSSSTHVAYSSRPSAAASPRPSVIASSRPSVTASPRRRLERTNSLLAVVGVQPQTRPPTPRTPGPSCNIDASWIDSFPTQDLKWLGSARTTLKTFTNGVADSFQADYEGDERIPPLSCAIAETLFRVYLRKRGHMANPQLLQKEFTRHARMLRSNIKNAHNPELRRDLVNGNITPQRLCEMTSDELAPEALRKARELRYELHARQNILREPTGPRLIKTKHGFKEVGFDQPGAEAETAVLPTLSTINLGQPSSPATETAEQTSATIDEAAPEDDAVIDDDAFEPDVEDDRTSLGDDPSPRPHPEISAESNHVENEVSERFQDSVDIRDKRNEPAKKVSFASDTPTASVQSRSAAEHASTIQPADEKPSVKEHHPRKRRPVSAAEGQAFLIMLFGPTYDVISQLQDWAKDLGRVPLSSMSHEFHLAPGVKLFRNLYPAPSHGTFLASVQLGHIYCEATARFDYEATYQAVAFLLNALYRFQRLFGDLLRQLSSTHRLIPSNDTRQVRDAAFSYLVEANIVQLTATEVRRFHFGAEVIQSDIVATIDDLPLAHARGSTVILARADTVQRLMTFLMFLVGQFDENQEQRRRDYRATVLQNCAAPLASSSESTWQSEPPRSQTPRVESPERMDVEDESFDDAHEPATANSRKRPYEYSAQLDDPPLGRDAIRRRVDSDVVTPVSSEEPAFFVDDVGERPRVQAPRLDAVMKKQAEAYQELLTLLFRDEAAVVSQLREVDWKDQDEAVFNFSRKIQMSGTITRDSSGTFTCTLVGLGDALQAKVSGRTALDVRESAVNLMVAHIRRIHDCWKQLVRTFKERSKVVSTLMAGHETQQKHLKLAVNAKPGPMKVVTQEERLIAPYQVYSIYVDNKLAVSAAAVNLKDAKRAASEFFRDVLEELVRIEAQATRSSASAVSQRFAHNGASHGSSNGTSSNNGTGNNSRANNSSNRNGNAVATTEPSRITRALVASDASDDDDDYYSSGGESDWDPNEAKQGGAEGSVQSRSSSSTAALSATELMKQPYDLQSESGASDDAKFRAVMRSLFTPSDDLCAGINHLRSTLKYRGVAEKVVVPNVKASIRINRLREGLFEVCVDVNDVIHFMEAKMTKPEAINAAIDGILAKLNTIRSVWVQLLHFLHVKCLSDTFLDAYNAMKLTGIISIKPTIESPPSTGQLSGRNGMAASGSSGGVHCAIRAGENVVFRVTGHTNAEAFLLADCRTAKFFEHLIDSGLDPESTEDEKGGIVDNAPANGALTMDSPIDWSCQIRVQDSGNYDLYHDFHVDAYWVRPHMAPSEKEFPRSDITVIQTGTISMAALEQMLLDRHESALVFFRLESTHEQWKLVKCIAAFGNKARGRASALELKLTGGSRFAMYVIPPGATINSSEKNLYWPTNQLPRAIAENYRDIYGFLTPKHL